MADDTPETEGIVTLADSHYYPGLISLYHSVQETYPVPLLCYDAGLTAEQIAHATSNYPNLRFRDIPSTEEIESIKSCFSSAAPLGKAGKRVWPLWICPLLIAASGFQRVFWLDSDLVVLRNLKALFDQLDSGPVFTVENNAPEATPNKPELYEHRPIKRSFDKSLPHVNGGVSGWDSHRDSLALQSYCDVVLHAAGDKAVRDSVSWHDQGALIWAIQNHGLEGRVLEDRNWNLCVKHSPILHHKLVWHDHIAAELREIDKEANIVHWNGKKVPWL